MFCHGSLLGLKDKLYLSLVFTLAGLISPVL